MRRRALLIGVPGGGINVTLAADRLTPLLQDLGFTVARCIGGQANRDAVLAAIDRIVRQTEAEDACFIHYFGHGGRIEFTDLEGSFAGTIFGFVSTIKESRSGGFAGVLDIELSTRFAELDRICANVVVMLDCCYSAELGRDTKIPLADHYRVPTPNLVRELLAQPQAKLALESHPRVIRLCSTSAKREAFATERRGRNIGHMTDAFVSILGDYELDEIAGLSWAGLIHDLRERVIARLEFEGQWVALAGPRNRLLFSRERCELPGTITFTTAKTEPGHGWLRGGWQQGLAVGDRWAVLDARVDEHGQAKILAEGTVRAVEQNVARFELDAAPPSPLPTGSPACPLAVVDAMPVSCEGPARAVVDHSAWLRASKEEQAEAAVRLTDAGVIVEDQSGNHPLLCVADAAQAIELLEQRARIRVLRRSLAAHKPNPCPLKWSCSLIGAEDQALASGARLRAGARVRVDVHNPEEPYNWFFSAVLIEADGRPRLLNARMPEGIEVCPGERECIGVRAGQRDQGFELRWLAGVDATSAPVSVLFLASRRTLQLGHIVREQLLDEDEALALSNLFDSHRQPPNVTPACAWAYLELTLDRE